MTTPLRDDHRPERQGVPPVKSPQSRAEFAVGETVRFVLEGPVIAADPGSVVIDIGDGNCMMVEDLGLVRRVTDDEAALIGEVARLKAELKRRDA
jgi:hypothetical protein